MRAEFCDGIWVDDEDRVKNAAAALTAAAAAATAAPNCDDVTRMTCDDEMRRVKREIFRLSYLSIFLNKFLQVDVQFQRIVSPMRYLICRIIFSHSAIGFKNQWQLSNHNCSFYLTFRSRALVSIRMSFWKNFNIQMIYSSPGFSDRWSWK